MGAILVTPAGSEYEQARLDSSERVSANDNMNVPPGKDTLRKPGPETNLKVKKPN